MVSRSSRRGNNIIEFAFLIPWYVFLFVGAYDFGFYSYSLISSMTAAHAVANYCAFTASNASNCPTSTSTQYTNACTYALNTLKYLPNIGTSVTSCASSPLTLSVTEGADSYGNNYSQVLLAYTTPQLIPIPGLLPGQITINKSATMIVTGT